MSTRLREDPRDDEGDPRERRAEQDEEAAATHRRHRRRGVAGRATGGCQSRRLSNWIGMPRSASRISCITACRSSRFLRRDADRLALRLAGDALRALLLDHPVDLAGLVRGDADLDRRRLAHRALGRLLDVAVLEALQRDLPLDELLLEHLAQRGEAVLADRAEGQDEVGLLDRRVRALEVEAGPDLALRLVDGVAHLLAIDLGHHIEAGMAARLVSRTGLRTSRRRRYDPPPQPWVGARVAKGSRL